MEERSKPIAIFMAFGTKGDGYPIAVSPSVLSLHFLFGYSENIYRKQKGTQISLLCDYHYTEYTRI